MRNVKVGIAYEGGIDAEIIAVIISRIFADDDLIFNDFEPATPGTAIVEFVPTYTKRFIGNNVDVGVFCTDQDDSDTQRRGDIEDKIRQVDESFLTKSIIGVAVPHIEAWLLADQDVVKNILGLAATDPLPYPQLPPKSRLLSMYSSEDSIYSKSMADLRIEIAKRMDINVATRHSQDFKRFVQNIRTIATSLRQAN